MSTIVTHARHHASVLATLEKRVLVGIAARLPRAIGSDHLTALGLLSMLAVGGAFAWSAHEPRACAVCRTAAARPQLVR